MTIDEVFGWRTYLVKNIVEIHGWRRSTLECWSPRNMIKIDEEAWDRRSLFQVTSKKVCYRRIKKEDGSKLVRSQEKWIFLCERWWKKELLQRSIEMESTSNGTNTRVNIDWTEAADAEGAGWEKKVKKPTQVIQVNDWCRRHRRCSSVWYLSRQDKWMMPSDAEDADAANKCGIQVVKVNEWATKVKTTKFWCYSNHDQLMVHKSGKS